MLPPLLAFNGCGPWIPAAADFCLRTWAMRGEEELDEWLVFEDGMELSKSDALVGGEDPSGEGFGGELPLVALEVVDVDGRDFEDFVLVAELFGPLSAPFGVGAVEMSWAGFLSVLATSRS